MKTSVLETKTKELQHSNSPLSCKFIICLFFLRWIFPIMKLFAFSWKMCWRQKLATFQRISGESLKWPECKSFLCFLLKVLLMAFSRECIYKPSIQLNIYYGFREENIVKLGALKQQMKEIKVNMNIKCLNGSAKGRRKKTNILQLGWP